MKDGGLCGGREEEGQEMGGGWEGGVGERTRCAGAEGLGGRRGLGEDEIKGKDDEEGTWEDAEEPIREGEGTGRGEVVEEKEEEGGGEEEREEEEEEKKEEDLVVVVSMEGNWNFDGIGDDERRGRETTCRLVRLRDIRSMRILRAVVITMIGVRMKISMRSQLLPA